MKRFFFWLMIFAVLLPMAAEAAPPADLWERWSKHDSASTATVDHSLWDSILGRYVVAHTGGINLMEYSRITPADSKALTGYIADAEKVAVSGLDRSEQLAFWINLYNALTVRVVLDHYPVDSILDIDISPGFFSDGPWGKKLVRIEGEALSLDDMEHRILRPIWKDRRIHYVLTCASMGCPNLQPQAFTSINSEILMDHAARQYVNDPRGVGFDESRLIVSSIYKWYADDFGGADTAIIDHLKHHADPPLRAKLQIRLRIDGYAYDWSLNDAR